MKQWIVHAPVECTGVYYVEAETEEEAKEALKTWDGSDKQVEFGHYSEEYPSSDVNDMRVEGN